MVGPQNGPELHQHHISAAQEAADNFCIPSDPFAPDHQMIAAQMLGQPMPTGQR